MTREQEVLLYLVRLGIGGDVEPDFVLDGVDWQELVDLSYRQGVAAIAVDGLQKVYESNPSLELALDSPELEAVKYEWFGAVFSEEENYSKISAVAKQISERLNAAGLRALLVKGLSYAAYYPEPKHRSFGDIDIFSPYSYAEIDDILRPMSQNFDVEYYRHSHCSLLGVTVENHKHLCDVRGQKRWLPLERELSRYADDVLGTKMQGGLYVPDNRLSVLFFLYHAQGHLLYESLSARFLADWAVILSREKSLVSSTWFSENVHRFGFLKITSVLTSLCVEYLGVDKVGLPPYLISLLDSRDVELEGRVLSDMFRKDKEGFGDSSFCSRVEGALLIFKRGWKSREFLGVGPMRFVFEKWVGIVRERLAKVEK